MTGNAIVLTPLQEMICAYPDRSERDRYRFLFAFDNRLADIVRTTSEELIGHMRLTWWREALEKRIAERPTGEPLLEFLAGSTIRGENSLRLASVIEGWQHLLEPGELGDEQLANYAAGRGEGFFGFAMGESRFTDEQAAMARGWALWDFAEHCSDPQIAERAASLASRYVAGCDIRPLSRDHRPLGILCHLARHRLGSGSRVTTLYRPSTAARIIWHGLTGR